MLTSCSEHKTVTLETSTVAKGEISESITATGTLESVTQVDVGTQVTGIISKLYADYNSEVKQGDVIAEIDKTTLESELKSANATLESAKISLEYAKKNYNRDKVLHDKQLISDYEFDTTKETYLKAQQTYDKSVADRVKAEKNLSYAVIYAPMDGIVISREVEIGQTVVSNMSVANLFVIADLDNMQVVADVDEADIGSVKVGQHATFTVDAYSNDTFDGVVTQVRINPTESSNVVTYEVLISVDNKEHKLIPGLTANVTIKTTEVKDCLTMPLKALRFNPQEFEGVEGLPTFDEMPKPKGNTEKPKEGETPKDPELATEDMHRNVWVVRNNKLVATEIELGVDNGVNAQVKSGLKAGDKVAIQYNENAESTENGNEKSSSPFMPGPKKNNKKK